MATPNSSGSSGLSGPRNDNLQLVGNLFARVGMKSDGPRLSAQAGEGMRLFLGRLGIAAIVLATGLALRAVLPRRFDE